MHARTENIYRMKMRQVQFFLDAPESSDIVREVHSRILDDDGREIELGFDPSEKIIFIECPVAERCECCDMKIRESRIAEIIFLKKCMKSCGFSIDNRHMKVLIKKMNQFLNGPGECHIKGGINMTDYKAIVSYEFISVFPYTSKIVIDYNDYSKIPL